VARHRVELRRGSIGGVSRFPELGEIRLAAPSLEPGAGRGQGFLGSIERRTQGRVLAPRRSEQRVAWSAAIARTASSARFNEPSAAALACATAAGSGPRRRWWRASGGHLGFASDSVLGEDLVLLALADRSLAFRRRP
jgi:hypothetical protein